jgi:hypothetical protein
MTDHFERALQERLLARSQVSSRDVEALRLFARTLPTRRPFWRAPVLQFAMSAAALVLAAVVVLPMFFQLPNFFATPVPASPTPAPTEPAPSQPAPTPATPAPATPVPSAPVVSLGPIRLAVVSGSVVNVTIDDPDGILTGAVAEQADPGMSFAWFNSSVEETADGAYRVTWVGYPRDEEVRLEVSQESGKVVLHFIQAAPLPNTDGEGEDRVMVIELADPIDASDIEVTFDTP